MKLIRKTLIFLLLLSPVFAQDKAQVPPGVNYKPATDIINNASQAELQKALAGDKSASKQLLSDALTCGPILWQSLAPTADKTLVQAKKIVSVIGVPDPKPVEGRTFATEAERQTFWRALFQKYPALANGRIRKANAYEISYYYATVPFDIQEPFFAIEAGPDVFVANLRMNFDKPVLFWIDRVGRVDELQSQQATSESSK